MIAKDCYFSRLVADCSRLHAAPPIIITFREFSPMPGKQDTVPLRVAVIESFAMYSEAKFMNVQFRFWS
jgi:hypothetical protein